MLTALPPLLAQLKSDPATAPAARLSTPLQGDNSFASLIRRQSEQRLDALRLADQQALAARVSAAAAAAKPRPSAEVPPARLPTPGQAQAGPDRQPASPPAQARSAEALARDGSAPPEPAPATQPPSASTTARAKPSGTTSQPQAPGSAAARKAPADPHAAGRATRERKAGATPGDEASAADPALVGAGLPPPLPAPASGPTGLPDLAHGAAGQAPGSALPATPGLNQTPTDLLAAPAADVIGASPEGAPAPADGPGQAAAQARLIRGQTGHGHLAADDADHPAPLQATMSARAEDEGADLGATASATAPRGRARLAAALPSDATGAGPDAPDAAGGQPAPPVDPDAAPTHDSPGDHRHRGSDRSAALPTGQPGEAAAAALAARGSSGLAPATGDKPGAPAQSLPTGRRTVASFDHQRPGPQLATQPTQAGALDSPGGAALAPAAAGPAGAVPQAFDNALQAVQGQGPAQTGPVGDAGRGTAPTLGLQIDAPVDSPLFAPALGSQLSLLARDGVRSALLQLHPAEMGPISVAIALDGNAARIDFQALRADTRGFIEASLPALAGALQDAGMTLAGGGVFEQPAGRQPQAQAEPGPGQAPSGRAETGPTGRSGQQDAAQPARRAAPRGLVDLVA